jgi:hypothetical protein
MPSAPHVVADMLGRQFPQVKYAFADFGNAAWQTLIKREQLVVQTVGQLHTGDRTNALLDEDLVEEAQHQRRVVRPQQLPGRTVPAQRDQFVVVQAPHPRFPLTRARSAPVQQRRPFLCHASPHADADTYARASRATTAP